MSDLDDSKQLQPSLIPTFRRVVSALILAALSIALLLAVRLDTSALQATAHGAEPESTELRRMIGKKRSLLQKLRQSNSGADCNGNGTPDADEIRNCIADPGCDDCNLNEVPDSCDITAGTSIDANMDGVPDECTFFDDGGADDNWSTPENWNNNEVPNNLDLINDESVTIDLNAADLDLLVEVDTLRLLDGAALDILGVSTEDFSIEEVGGIQIASDFAQQSTMLVGNTRKVSVPIGTLHIMSGGVYAASNFGQQPAASRLEAANVLIESRCGEPVPGEMTLSGLMDTEIQGDLVIDARQDCVVCAFCTTGMGTAYGTVSGGETPPILRIRDAAVLRVHGSLAILGPGQFIHSSTVPVEIGGDFINESPCPQCFQGTGTFMLGPTSTPFLPQEFEVAGADVGPIAAGFDENFALDAIEITSDAEVSFIDTFPNTATGMCEAQYVRTLILHNNATISLTDCRLYYGELINKGGSVVVIGTGALIQVIQSNLGGFSSLATCLSGPNQPLAQESCATADLDRDGDVDLDDMALFEIGFTGG